MQITTKFNVGDSVVFLHHNAFYRSTVTSIEIEAHQRDDKTSTVIKYYFAGLRSDFQNCQPDYKYESEIAATKEELAKNFQESILQ